MPLLERVALILCCGMLAGCAQSVEPPVVLPTTEPDQTRPQARPDVLDVSQRPPAEDARTVEDFDTTTKAERAKAAAPAEAPESRALGTTVVSLGDPAKAGFWLETPLVADVTQGTVVNPQSGKSVQVELIPIDGPSTAGSRMSLAAMRLIGAPLTDLVEVEVFSGR